MRAIVAGAAALAVFMSGPAQAACWTPSQVSAARVQELDTMLMVAALRCRPAQGLVGRDLLTAYNAVVTRHRAVLAAGNGEVRDYFTAALGAKAMMAAYDTHVTRVANRYGSGSVGPSCEQLTDVAQALLVEVPSRDALDAHAQRAAIEAVAVEQQCAVSLETIVIAEAAKRANASGDAAPRLAMVPLDEI